MTPLVRHKNNANTSNFQFSLRRWISELTFTPVLISSTTSKHPIVLPSIQPYRRIRPEPAGLPPLTSIHSFDLLYETETTSHSRLCLVTPPIHSLTRFIFVEPNGLLKPIQNRFCVATGCEPPFALHQQQLVHKVEVPFSDIDLKASTISAQPALSGTGRPAVAHLDFDFSPFPHLRAQEGNGRAIRSYWLIPSTLRIKKQTPSSEVNPSIALTSTSPDTTDAKATQGHTPGERSRNPKCTNQIHSGRGHSSSLRSFRQL
jgi:hypothetical protein